MKKRETLGRDQHEQAKRPVVTINGQPIDTSDQDAIDEAFKRIARTRDRVVASLHKHLGR